MIGTARHQYLKYATACLILAVTSSMAHASSTDRINQEDIKPIDLSGTWYFVRGEYRSSDGKVTTVDNKLFKALRTMTADRFAVTNMRMGEYLGYIQGRYEVTGRTMTEWPSKGSGGNLIGKKLSFTFTINGGCWILQGQEGETHIREIWRKLDEPSAARRAAVETCANNLANGEDGK